MRNVKKLACQLPYGGRKARKALSIRPQQVLSSRVPPSVCIHIRQKDWRKRKKIGEKRKKIGEKEKRLEKKEKKLEKKKKDWRKRKKIGEKEKRLEKKKNIGEEKIGEETNIGEEKIGEETNIGEEKIGEKEISLQQRFCIGEQLRKPFSHSASKINQDCFVF